MGKVEARYVISVYDEAKEPVLYSGPLDLYNAEYLIEKLAPQLRPLLAEDYKCGHAAIIQTAARYCYVLHEQSVFWCVEWDPGLIVVKFNPDGSMYWSAFRSPVPDFGGRAPEPEDTGSENEDVENPQYGLIFDAWDAEQDELSRTDGAFRAASDIEVKEFKAALEGVSKLEDELGFAASGERDGRWVEKCIENLTVWAGKGVRVGR